MARILLLPIVFFLLIDSIASKSNQEDLLIANYSHVGCLTPYPDKEFLFNNIQETTQLPYQTFSSSNLTIELCFRLCRRWIVLLNSDHTNCICLYTTNEIYEIHEHLGEVTSFTNCTNTTVEIYSVTKDPYILSPAGETEDWSFEGCYYLHGIQTYRADLVITTSNYTQALNACRIRCQTDKSPNYISFFLSFGRSCYCLPIRISALVTTVGLRKPLVHCSFLPGIQNGFTSKLNSSEIHTDTVAKINLQRYCATSFLFNRNLYVCLRMVPLGERVTYASISTIEQCSPILIKTLKQWKDFLAVLPASTATTFVWVNRNSTYLFDDLFKSKASLISSKDVCLKINQARPPPNYDLISCSDIRFFGYILCVQQPFQTPITDESDFTSTKTLIPIRKNITCPTSFILFDNRCYYVDSSFIYNITHAEQLCADKYLNSTLVKFSSHEWGNVNTTRFLGRRFDDVLIELFYYQLEKQLRTANLKNSTNKHWLRLLIGDRNNSDGCVLRYYVRSSGAFTVLHRCVDGGHPVCQTNPIAIEINPNSSTIIPDTTTTTTVEPILSNRTLADEDLIDNETDIYLPFDTNSTKISGNSKYSRHIFLLFIIGPLVACFSLLLGVILFVRQCRRSRGSYSTQRQLRQFFGRKKRSPTPTATTSADNIANTPAVLYTRLQTSEPEIPDMNEVFDDNVQLLPSTFHQMNTHENTILGENEEPVYATLKLPNEK